MNRFVLSSHLLQGAVNEFVFFLFAQHSIALPTCLSLAAEAHSGVAALQRRPQAGEGGHLLQRQQLLELSSCRLWWAGWLPMGSMPLAPRVAASELSPAAASCLQQPH